MTCSILRHTSSTTVEMRSAWTRPASRKPIWPKYSKPPGWNPALGSPSGVVASGGNRPWKAMLWMVSRLGGAGRRPSLRADPTYILDERGVGYRLPKPGEVMRAVPAAPEVSPGAQWLRYQWLHAQHRVGCGWVFTIILPKYYRNTDDSHAYFTQD